jgi:hypothetical protein
MCEIKLSLAYLIKNLGMNLQSTLERIAKSNIYYISIF